MFAAFTGSLFFWLSDDQNDLRKSVICSFGGLLGYTDSNLGFMPSGCLLGKSFGQTAGGNEHWYLRAGQQTARTISKLQVRMVRRR